MSATETLREDHRQIRRLDRVITKCYTGLYAGKEIPVGDIGRITSVIDGFLDSIHYSREEDSYFPCVASYGHLREEIRRLLIEHEFSRRIAAQIKRHLKRWREGGADGARQAREPVARYLRTYSVYLMDHMAKEEDFFDRAEAEELSGEEEREMYEQFSSTMAVSKGISEMAREIDYLESLPWARGG